MNVFISFIDRHAWMRCCALCVNTPLLAYPSSVKNLHINGPLNCVTSRNNCYISNSHKCICNWVAAVSNLTADNLFSSKNASLLSQCLS